MTRLVRRRPATCAAVGAVCLLLAPARGRGEDIVIGMSAAFRGPSCGLGTELYRGALAYFSEVNSRGGVHGRRIVLRAYDDGYDPTRAIENTCRLINEHKVFLLFGYVGTPTTIRVLPLLTQHTQPTYLFFPFSGASRLRRGPYHDCVFNLRASYSEETGVLVDRLVAIGRKRIAVFYQIDSYGRSGWCGVRQALAAKGLTIAAEATYRRGAGYGEGMHEQVRLLRRADPDAVVCVGSYAACAAFIRDARDAGWEVPIANVSFVGSESLLALLRRAGAEAGKDYTRNLINSQVVPNYHRTDLPAVAEYRRLMERHRPQTPPGLSEPGYQPPPYSFVGFEGFLDAKLLVKVLEEVGPELRRDRVKAAAERVKDFDLGIDAPVTFRPDRHQALDRVYCTTVEGDRFVRLSDWRRWAK